MLPLDQVIDSYLLGMKKKLALMGLLKKNKPVMILDEPFNGLDIETGRILRLILLQLRDKGKTIIVTSHIIETLTNLCDYIHHFDRGKNISSHSKEGFLVFEKTVYKSIEEKNEQLIGQLLDRFSDNDALHYKC